MVRKTTPSKSAPKAETKAESAKKVQLKPETTTVELSAPAPKKTPGAPKKSASKPVEARPVFSLHVGSNFTLLTQDLEGGALTVLPPVGADALLKVSYWKEPQHLERHEVTFTSVKLHCRVDGGEELTFELGHVVDGRFLRTPAPVELGPTARLLEYWFELKTSAGEVLWDSNWGNNHWLSVAPAAVVSPVEVLFDSTGRMA